MDHVEVPVAVDIEQHRSPQIGQRRRHTRGDFLEVVAAIAKDPRAEEHQVREAIAVDVAGGRLSEGRDRLLRERVTLEFDAVLLRRGRRDEGDDRRQERCGFHE